MKLYVVFDKITGRIIRSGACQDVCFGYGLESNEAVVEGFANDVTQKVLFDGLDERGQPINPRIVEKQKVAK